MSYVHRSCANVTECDWNGQDMTGVCHNPVTLAFLITFSIGYKKSARFRHNLADRWSDIEAAFGPILGCTSVDSRSYSVHDG